MSKNPWPRSALGYVFVRCACGARAVRRADAPRGQCPRDGGIFWPDEAENLHHVTSSYLPFTGKTGPDGFAGLVGTPRT